MPLSDRERRFVEAMSSPTVASASEAARIAGYSPKGSNVAAIRLLRRATVQQALQKRQEKLSVRADLSDARILAELAEVGYTTLEKGAVRASDKVKALEILAKHKGLLSAHDDAASKITVNIGFLSPSQTPALTTISTVQADTIDVTTEPPNYLPPQPNPNT